MKLPGIVENHSSSTRLIANGRIVVMASKTIIPCALALGRICNFLVADHVREQRYYWHSHFYGDRLLFKRSAELRLQTSSAAPLVRT